jgi:ABC-type branched-subunit amino acid transport system ATPase component
MPTFISRGWMELIAQGSPAEVRGNTEVRRIYLGRRQ